MSTVVVRYRTRADRADENERLVRAVFDELARTDPGGLRYATFRLADGTFVHVAEIEGDTNPLGGTEAFAEFQRELGERCEPGNEPNPQPASLVGSYRMFVDGAFGT